MKKSNDLSKEQFLSIMENLDQDARQRLSLPGYASFLIWARKQYRMYLGMDDEE